MDLGVGDLIRFLLGFAVPYVGTSSIVPLVLTWEIFYERNNRLFHFFIYVFGWVTHVFLVTQGWLAF
jgi:hypothetical protein